MTRLHSASWHAISVRSSVCRSCQCLQPCACQCDDTSDGAAGSAGLGARERLAGVRGCSLDSAAGSPPWVCTAGLPYRRHNTV